MCHKNRVNRFWRKVADNYGKEKSMLAKKQLGASLVEWVVVVVVVVAVLGAAALGIATVAGGKAGSVQTWINNLSVP
jgi:Tfp pilus assembly protein PilV